MSLDMIGARKSTEKRLTDREFEKSQKTRFSLCKTLPSLSFR